MSRYAAETNVSSEQSRAEIERTLQKYGADQRGLTMEHRTTTTPGDHA